MTEKHYGGANQFGVSQPKSQKAKKAPIKDTSQKFSKQAEESNNEDLNINKDSERILKLKQAGKIAKQVVEYAKTIIKPNTSLLEIAEKIEKKIEELKAKPAFPVNLSINEIAAHSTPSYNDTSLANGLLKIDIGVHIDGHIADTAFSIDLENSEENKQLIKAAEDCLNQAIQTTNLNTQLGKIGDAIEKTALNHNTIPIHNLSGHEIKKYELHAGITIPNYGNHQELTLQEGLYAIEPFTTLSSGTGAVKDSKPSGIYSSKKEGNVRDPIARKILQHVIENYQTLPFCSRWLVKIFSTRALIALSQLEQAGILHQYPQLIERSGAKIAQAEHTILITGKEKIVTTL